MVEEKWQSVCPLRLEFGAKASRLGAPPWHDAWDAAGAQETLGKRQEKECGLNESHRFKGKFAGNHRNPLYLGVQSMVSCRLSLKPIH